VVCALFGLGVVSCWCIKRYHHSKPVLLPAVDSPAVVCNAAQGLGMRRKSLSKAFVHFFQVRQAPNSLTLHTALWHLLCLWPQLMHTTTSPCTRCVAVVSLRTWVCLPCVPILHLNVFTLCGQLVQLSMLCAAIVSIPFCCVRLPQGVTSRRSSMLR
jgi:hypothetical protein